MKCAVLILAALIGLSSALQYPYSYEYNYHGSIKAGVPEAGNQFSSSVIKAKLLVTVASASEAYVQIKDPEVGEYMGSVQQQGRATPQISNWAPLKDKQVIEQPFAVQFSGSQEILQVPENELLWISNLRKAIVSILRVPYVLSSPPSGAASGLGNKIVSDGSQQSFKKQEETIFGRCRSMYTLTQASPNSPMVLDVLQEDVSSSGSERVGYRRQGHRYESSGSAAYRLVKNIDLDDCSELVVTAKANAGNFSDVGKGQLRGFQSRSSFGEYLLTGTPSGQGSLRVEKAYLEGFLSSNPRIQDQDEKIVVYSNQTLTLLKMSESRSVNKPTVPLKNEPWFFRMTSPSKPGPNPPSWVSYQSKGDSFYPHIPEHDLTGFQIDSQFKQQVKSSIMEMIASLSQSHMILTPNNGKALLQDVYQMDSMASRVRALPYEDLKQLFTEIVGTSQNVPAEQSIRRSVGIEIFSTAGSPAAVKVLVENIQQGKLSVTETTRAFRSLQANIASPINLPQLMNYAKSLGEGVPQSQKSSVYIAVSAIIRRLCIRPIPRTPTYQYPKVMYGAQVCPMNQIMEEYVPFLIQKTKSAQNPQDKAIMIQALTFLGDQKTVALLSQIAKGNLQGYEATILRVIAITGLSHEYMLPQTTPYAEQTLQLIAEEQNEKDEIRKTALVALTTLPHNATYWQRLAMNTWREPSNETRDFMQAILAMKSENFNPIDRNETASAKHAAALGKMYYDYPHIHYYEDNTAFPKADRESRYIHWDIRNGFSVFDVPGTYSSYQNTAGGIKFNVWESYKYGDCPVWSLDQLLLEESKRNVLKGGMQSGASQEFESHTSSHISSEERLNYCIQFNRLMQNYINFTVSASPEPELFGIGRVFELLRQQPRTEVKYNAAVDITIVTPTDIGLPIITQVTTPTMSAKNFTVSSSKQVSSIADIFEGSAMEVSGNYSYRFASKFTTTVKALVPWNNKTVGAVVDFDTTIILPYNFEATLDRQSASYNQLKMEVRPATQSQVEILSYAKTPFVQLRPLYPSKDITEGPVLFVKRSQSLAQTVLPLPRERTGIVAEIKYEGDKPLSIKPSTLLDLINVMRNPLTQVPSLRGKHSFKVTVDPASSATKKISFFMVHAKVPARSSLQASSQQPLVQGLSVCDAMAKRMELLRSSPAPVDTMWSFKVKFEGTADPLKMEGVYMKMKTAQRATKFYQFNYMQAKSGSEQQMCVSSKIASGTSQEGTLSDIFSNIFYGRRCSPSNEVFQAKTVMETGAPQHRHLRIPISLAKYFNMELKQKQAIPQDLEAIKGPLNNIVSEILRPHCTPSFTRVPSEEGYLPTNILNINGTRPGFGGPADLKWKVSGLECSAKKVRLPTGIRTAINSGLRRVLSSSQVSHLSAECTVTSRSVKTFLNQIYEKESIPCVTIAAADLKQQGQKFVVSVKEQASKQEVKVVYPNENLVVKMKHAGIWVNNERVSESQKEIKSQHGKTLLIVQQNANSRSIEIPGKLAVELESQGEVLKIKVSEAYRSKLSGLCGKFSQSRVADLRDSQGCYYKPQQGKIYAAAWIATNDVATCRQASPQMSAIIQEAEQMAHHCPKSLHSLSLHRHPRRA